MYRASRIEWILKELNGKCSYFTVVIGSTGVHLTTVDIIAWEAWFLRKDNQVHEIYFLYGMIYFFLVYYKNSVT